MYLGFLVLFVTSCGPFANSFSALDIGYNAAQQDYECPPMCTCDLFLDMNRANCRFGVAFRQKENCVLNSFRFFQSSEFDWGEY